MLKYLLTLVLSLPAIQMPAASAHDTGGDMNIAVQLWSVRDALESDFEATLRALAAMGFKGVEFAGHYGSYAENPTGLRALLREVGLQVAGAHVGTDQLRGEILQQTIDFHKALGTPWLVIPWDERAWDDEGVYELAAELNTLAMRLSADNLRVGYHSCHHFVKISHECAQHPTWQTGFVENLGEFDRGQRCLFRGLEQDGRTGCNRGIESESHRHADQCDTERARNGPGTAGSQCGDCTNNAGCRKKPLRTQ